MGLKLIMLVKQALNEYLDHDDDEHFPDKHIFVG